jgi:hypothetical protein
MCFVTAHGVNQVQFQIARRVRSLPRMPRALALSAGARPLSALPLGTGDLSRKTAAKYRALAEECFKWSRETHDSAVRKGYLGLAQVWLDAASQRDGLPAARIPPTPDETPKTALPAD